MFESRSWKRITSFEFDSSAVEIFVTKIFWYFSSDMVVANWFCSMISQNFLTRLCPSNETKRYKLWAARLWYNPTKYFGCLMLVNFLNFIHSQSLAGHDHQLKCAFYKGARCTGELKQILNRTFCKTNIWDIFTWNLRHAVCL